MSGVFGFVDSRGTNPAPLLARMGTAMAHLPWFTVDSWTDAPAGVGLGRLGIGLLDADAQPACSDDGGTRLVMCGELYAREPLRRALECQGATFRHGTDAELMLRLYEADGLRSLARVEGMFVVAVWDAARQQLTIANDRSGLYPLLYAHLAGRFVFAPEMKGVLAHPAFARRLDLTAIAEYVRFQFLLGDKTFFEGLSLLPNATVLRYERGGDTLTREGYWDFSRVPLLDRAPSLDEAAEEAGRRLRVAVNRLAAGSLRAGVFLSGGLDSRAILGLLDGAAQPLPTVTWGLPGSRDTVYARRLAAIVPTQHHELPIEDGRWVPEAVPLHLELTEGFHSWIHAHGLSVLPQVRELMQVSLSGLHGAELNWEDPDLYDPPDDHAFFNRLFRAMTFETTWPGLDEAEAHGIFAPRLARDLNARVFESLRAELASCADWPYPTRVAHMSFQADRRLYQCFTLFNRAYVEQRFPYHDPSYLDFVHALPPRLLFKRQLRKAVILRYAPALARVPTDKDDVPLFRQAWRAQAAGLARRARRYVNRHAWPVFRERPVLYTDYEGWLRGELREWGEGILFDGRLEAQGLLDPSAVRSLWRRLQSGREANIIGKLASIMSLTLVIGRFCGDDAGPGRVPERAGA
jgi:asparagine synthase (glutamine-hydrolysing)